MDGDFKSPEKEKPKRYKCYTCILDFTSFAERRTHYDSKAHKTQRTKNKSQEEIAPKVFKCFECKLDFTSLTERRTHYDSKAHKDVMTKNEGLKDFKCHACKLDFTTWLQRRTHYESKAHRDTMKTMRHRKRQESGGVDHSTLSSLGEVNSPETLDEAKNNDSHEK